MLHTNPAPAELHPSSEQLFLSTLSSSTHTFLQPSLSLHAASLVLAKRYLDPLAQSTSDIQAQRQQRARRKRKRGQPDGYYSEHILRMKEIHTEGFGIEQIWEQARRVLDASRQEADLSIHDVRASGDKQATNGTLGNGVSAGERPQKMVTFDEDEVQIGSTSSGTENEEGDNMLGDKDAEEGNLNADRMPSDEELEELGVDEDMIGDLGDGDDHANEKANSVFVPDRHGLNDGFFSIDDFNRQSEFLEQQDAKGDPDDGAASDEEDVDWDADPVALTLLPNGASKSIEEADGSSKDEEDGPTFEDADLNGDDISEGSDAEVAIEDSGLANTNDILYADFFAPPPKKASKKHRALPKTQPPSSLAREPDVEDDIQRTISAVRRDIFEDDLSPNESEDLSAASDPDAPLSRRSNHEKRQAKLAAEIRKLEAANVAKRDWTLSGEARAADRPLNSLLEEDLEFERAGKPIPVITSEVSEDIEALIKRRILARDFDEVIRRRPGDLVTGAKDVRRGRFELDDSKPQQSLAEVYEAEHLQTVDPDGYMSKRDEKLKKDHDTIEKLWANVSAKLDALSSWHYKPKPPEANINVVADVPTISMEDAQPSAGGDVGGSMLAPQEIYKAGEGVDKKREIVPKSGLVKAREEMTREEKLRRRRREKERIKKAGGLVDGKKVGSRKVDSKREKEKEIVNDLKRGGVKVIDPKKGDLKEVDGRAARARSAVGSSGGAYKL